MITIDEKLRPFSHRPGISCLIPKTGFEVEVFPALVRIYDITQGKRIFVKEEEIAILGPLKDFTVVQDLEKGVVTVFGKDLFFHIKPDLTFAFQKKTPNQDFPKREKLFLGMHKQQDWEGIFKRKDFREIFPIWFQLGTLLPKMEALQTSEGIFSLLNECKMVIEKHKPEKILDSFLKLFLTAFRGMLVPRLQDDDHQGILFDKIVVDNPLHILSEGAILIRSLFLKMCDEQIHILPNLPPDFFSGCIINLNIAPYGIISIEWTKKMVRRIVLESSYDGPIFLSFHPSLKKCRVRRNEKEMGYPLICGNALDIKSKGVYLLDRFEK